MKTNNYNINIIGGMLISLIMFFIFREVYLNNDSGEFHDEKVERTDTISIFNRYWLEDSDSIGFIFVNNGKSIIDINNQVFEIGYDIKDNNLKIYYLESDEVILEGKIMLLTDSDFVIGESGGGSRHFYMEEEFW